MHPPLKFQFTLPCRERHTFIKGAFAQTRFNSRSRVGSDAGTDEAAVMPEVSIHAPV